MKFNIMTFYLNANIAKQNCFISTVETAPELTWAC